jgi:hypothetical protein
MWPHRSQEMKLKHIAKQSFDKRVTTVLIRIPISLNQMFHTDLKAAFSTCYCFVSALVRGTAAAS